MAATSAYRPKVLKTRRKQAYFPLTQAEIDRLRRFGEPRQFADGDYLVHAGETGLGITVILSGKVDVLRRTTLGHEQTIVSYTSRHFIGEVGQLSGRASFIDARAKGPVQALIIPPVGLRGLVVAEAELGERIMRALILRRMGLIEVGVGGPALVGPPATPGIVRLRNFLQRNGIPHQVLDPAHEHEAEALIASVKPGKGELPLVVCPNGQVLRNPTERELAECIGLLTRLDPDKTYDVAVVGAGPAGLATAVYAASEGLSVVVLESRAYGGQAGASSRIENYLGFPTGVSGQALAGRAFAQAQKFGADVVIPASVVAVDCNQPDGYLMKLSDGDTIRSKTVVIASGAEYRRPKVPGLQEAESDGVHYWASPVEGALCSGQDVTLVGGGNSAGQAAVYLASKAKKVWMLVRREGLEATMSKYLIDRIKAQANIELLPFTEIDRLDIDGAGSLCTIAWRNKKSGRTDEKAMRHLFLFIGADPCTEWMEGCDTAVDDKGFVLTGRAARPDDEADALALQTSLDGVFAIGDVRSGSVKRVAAAVGEGAAVVAQIHGYLASLQAQEELQGASA